MDRLSWLRLGIVWLVGVNLRITLLAIPPVIPLIHRDVHLSETGIGALTGLAVLLLAAGAVPGSLLIARCGARCATIIGILLLGTASGLRGLGPSAAVLFAMTFVMGVGVAVAQPAVPSLIARWFPAHVGLATALYVNGLLVGETLSASLTLPVVLPLVGGSWKLSFAAWAVVPLLTGLLMMALGSALPDEGASSGMRWVPDWRRARTWQLGFILGGASAAYFGSNAFIPDFLRAVGRAALIGPCLTALNAGQIPASIAVILIAPRIVGRRMPLVGTSMAVLAGLAVFLTSPPAAQIASAGFLGLCFAFVFVLSLALPPLLAGAGEVHRLSAGMLAIGYGYSFVLPLVGGAAWDLSRVPAAAFLPVCVGALTTLVAASALGLRPECSGEGSA